LTEFGSPEHRRELLDRVYLRGQQIKRRRRILRIAPAGAAGLLAVVLIALAVAPGGDEQGVRTVNQPDGVTTTADQSTTTSTTILQPAPTSPTSPGPGGSPGVAGPVCRNSADPACGEFRWDPAPAPNDPLTVTVTFTPEAPVAGDTVTFNVVAEDPDAAVHRECDVGVAFGDGQSPRQCISDYACEDRHGPWSPPAEQPDRFETTFTHVYEQPGEYVANFEFTSEGGCFAPYESQGSQQVTVIVGAPPTTTTTAAPPVS
jgi:hypothetical protein